MLWSCFADEATGVVGFGNLLKVPQLVYVGVGCEANGSMSLGSHGGGHV